MFEAVATSESLHLRGSFWQCFKAGFAFTCGALVATGIVTALYLTFWVVGLASLASRR